MPAGNVTLAIKDGGLGIIPAASSNIHVVMGTSSAGTVNTLYSFGSIDDIQTTLTSGPLAEALAYELSISGGTIYGMPVNASVPGTSGAVTPTRVGASNGTVTVSVATANDAYSVIAKVVSAGVGQLVTGALVAVQISLDGGLTYGQSTLVPVGGTFVITGTGLTVAFSVAASTFDFGDQFSFTCTAPFYSSTDLNAAFAALFALPQTWGFIHVVGYPTAGASLANATAGATLASTVSTQLATGVANFRYGRCIMEAPASLDADLTTAYASFADGRVMVVAGTDPLNSPMTGRKLTRSHAWATSARLGAIRVSRSPGAVADGPLLGVVSLNRDERKTPGLYDQRFSVATTYIGINGFYSDFGKTMAAAGSDFTNIMNGRVLDQACVITRAALLLYLNSSVRVNAGGTILEQDARGIENFVTQQIRGAMSPDISDVSVSVNRTDNILSTQLLRVKTRVTPLGYAASISEDIGFQNPSLVLS